MAPNCEMEPVTRRQKRCIRCEFGLKLRHSSFVQQLPDRPSLSTGAFHEKILEPHGSFRSDPEIYFGTRRRHRTFPKLCATCRGGRHDQRVFNRNNACDSNSFVPVEPTNCLGLSRGFHRERLFVEWPALSYQWYKNSLSITGATSNTLYVSAATVADAASYFLRITDGTNTTSTASFI